MTDTPRNEYDETKAFLNKIRKLTKTSAQDIREQLDTRRFATTEYPPTTSATQKPEPLTQPTAPQTSQSTEKNDFAVINNVEVVINSTDRDDLKLGDEEKGKISQLIDDFRSEVSEIAEFGKLNIYDDSAKLDGNIKEVNLGFTISAGDDNGVFLSNAAMLQINDNSMAYIDKLKKFQLKFNDTMGTIIATRQQN